MRGGGAALVNHFWVHFFILLSLFAISRSDPDCVYTVYVKTGSADLAGTDSTISLTLYDAGDHAMTIGNLTAWGGLMGPDYNYFEKGNLDIFSGRGPCLPEPVCKMNLTSDGSGALPEWYCDSVGVTTTGFNVTCAQQDFKVDQWLSPILPPWQLTVIRDNCLPKTKREVIGGSEFSPLLGVM